MQQNGVECKFTNSDSWVILSPIEQSIKRKIESVGTLLKDWDINIYRGVLTGCNEAFIINTEKRDKILSNCKTEEERIKTEELIRPILRGRDIKRYGYDWADLWLIATFPSRHYDIDDYPSVKDYLLSFGIERLEQTGETHIINGEKVKARKKTNNKWFETQDSISYWEDFDKQKIIWGNLSLSANYSMADQSLYINAPANILIPGNEYVLAVLNSKVADYYIRMLGVTRNGGYFEYKPMFVQQMPIPKLKEDDVFLQHINSLIAEHRYDEVDGLIFMLYGLNEEESNYISAL